MIEAMKCYDEGIAQEFTDGELRGKLHCNRAFLHLKNSNTLNCGHHIIIQRWQGTLEKPYKM